jgi:hypothetical protein
MAIQNLTVEIVGISPLLQNNPQTVDVFNKYSKLKKPLTSKRAKTDEDVLALRELETESKIYWDDDLKVYVPTRWVMAAITKNSYKLTKISKDAIRGGVFLIGDKAKLSYDGMKTVKRITDISRNEKFTRLLILPQGQVRLAKSFPVFHDWSFTVSLEYDDTVVDERSLIQILEHSAKYGGFGDFRPSYGRGVVNVK